MSTYRLGLPSELKRQLESVLPRYKGVSATVGVAPRDRRERRCAAYDADHYEVQAYYTTASQGSLDLLEAALRAVPGVYATTQVRGASDSVTAPRVFSNSAWPAALGTARRDRAKLRAQVLALIRDEHPAGDRSGE